MSAKEFSINVTSGYGANTRRGFVALQVADLKPIQMSAEEARDLAGNLFGAAEAAEQDAFLVRFFTDNLGMILEDAAQVLRMFREEREARE